MESINGYSRCYYTAVSRCALPATRLSMRGLYTHAGCTRMAAAATGGRGLEGEGTKKRDENRKGNVFVALGYERGAYNPGEKFTRPLARSQGKCIIVSDIVFLARPCARARNVPRCLFTYRAKYRECLFDGAIIYLRHIRRIRRIIDNMRINE